MVEQVKKWLTANWRTVLLIVGLILLAIALLWGMYHLLWGALGLSVPKGAEALKKRIDQEPGVKAAQARTDLHDHKARDTFNRRTDEGRTAQSIKAEQRDKKKSLGKIATEETER